MDRSGDGSSPRYCVSPLQLGTSRPHSGPWSQCLRASERGLSMNEDLRSVVLPTGCGVSSPSPPPSPAGRGRTHICVVVWLDALDLRVSGR